MEDEFPLPKTLPGDHVEKDTAGRIALRSRFDRGWTARQAGSFTSPPTPGSAVSWAESLYEVTALQQEANGAITYFMEPWDERFLVRRVLAYEEFTVPVPAAVTGRARAGSSPHRPPGSGTRALSDFLGKIPLTWRMLLCGGITAVFFSWFFPVQIFSNGISFFVHELGHTAVSLFFGRFAVPAVLLTITFEQTLFSVICVWFLLGLLTWYFREYTLFRNVMAVVLVIYPFLARSSFHETLITLGGHGTEIGCAAWFFLRVFAGEGHKIWERTVYAFLGWFLWERNTVMFTKLIFSPEFQEFYYTFSTTGGDNDLVKVAKAYSVRLESVSFLMLVLSLVIPAAALAWGFIKSRGETRVNG